MITINPKIPVCVTGVSGYIAGEITKQLLEQGTPVNGTVRSLSNSSVQHLQKISEETGTAFTLFEANLDQAGSFDEAVKGCELVIHVASPFKMAVKDPVKELINPAVHGVQYVLDAVEKTPTVKRVVQTSSCYAIYGDNVDALDIPNHTFDETYWNETSSEHHQPYAFSKVSAEKQAWETANHQDRWDLVTINPSFVLGPATNPLANFESKFFFCQLCDGTYKSGVPDISVGVVDVRNVAQAHIKAGFSPKASGRYICSGYNTTFLELAQRLRKNHDHYPIPKSVAPKWLIWILAPFIGLKRSFVSKNIGIPCRVNNAKSIKELNMDYIPLDDTLEQFFAQMVESGCIPQPKK